MLGYGHNNKMSSTMTIDSLPLPLYFYVGNTTPLFNVERNEYRDETRASFNDCDPSCCLGEKNAVRNLPAKDVWFVHYKFKHAAKQSGISKKNHFSPVMWHGGAYMASITKRNSYVSAI